MIEVRGRVVRQDVAGAAIEGARVGLGRAVGDDDRRVCQGVGVDERAWGAGDEVDALGGWDGGRTPAAARRRRWRRRRRGQARRGAHAVGSVIPRLAYGVACGGLRHAFLLLRGKVEGDGKLRRLGALGALICNRDPVGAGR